MGSTASNKSQPVRKPEKDGVYPRCVWCGSENYAPAVVAYSKGKASCWQCGKKLPKEYIKL